MVSKFGVFGQSWDRSWLSLIAIILVLVAIFHDLPIEINEIKSKVANSPYFYNTEDLITMHGYPAEVHTVVTEDGYVLQLHRIPFSKYNNCSQKYNSLNHSDHISRTYGPPVVMHHGFVSASSSWVFQGPDKDLAFLLSDEGYDVWLLNGRGNSYTSLHPTASIVFNDFSFHEIGTIDLPTSLDYILAKTGYQNVSFVGHSMGTTVLMVGLAALPEYNKIINSAIMIAPILARGPFTELLHQIPESIYLIFSEIGNNAADLVGLFKRGIMQKIVAFFLHNYNTWVHKTLYMIVNEFAGPKSTCHISIPMSVIVSHNFDGLTHNILNHFYQNILKGDFLMRDYGTEGNMLRYNSTKPLPYDLKRVTAHITAYAGDADIIAPVQDFKRHLPKFQQDINLRLYSGYNHFDLIWSNEASNSVFIDISEELRIANHHVVHRLRSRGSN